MTYKKTAPTNEERRLAREWAAFIESSKSEWTERIRAAARVILNEVPAPTLADMTANERAACQWMQADVKGYESRVVIVNPYWEDGLARVMWLHTRMNPVSWKSVTPRPDLPRLEWPGDTTVAPDHLAVGTVIESADDPRIATLPVGTILLDRNEEATTKRPQPWGWTGLGNTPAEDEGDEPGPWTVLHIPKEADQ